MKYLADFITAARIVFALAILTVPVFSTAFYVLYLLAGVSDMMDGPVARLMHSESEFGFRLDTVISAWYQYQWKKQNRNAGIETGRIQKAHTISEQWKSAVLQ